MSGFVAVLARCGALDPAVVDRFAETLAMHRGTPVARYLDGPVALLQADFIVRDRYVPGPWRDARGRAFAGDIRVDAQEALRDALAATGRPISPGAGDEALLLAAWDAWGEEALTHVLGDYSFALWDATRHRLFCARDRFGVRPLYYAEFGDVWVCGNILEVLRAHPRATTRLHLPAIVSFLQYGYNADLTTTTFADVRRLAPAHQCLVGPDIPPASRRYWSLPAPAPLRLRDEESYAAHYRAVLGEAVRDRLRVPRAGILLSGGLDSPSLAATARRVAPTTAMHAYTTAISSVLPSDDEAHFATLVAQRLGMRHEIVEDVPLPLAHLSDPGFHTPEPFDEPDTIVWRRLAARIAAETSVLFVGEDGDALFQPPGLWTMLRTLPPGEVFGSVACYTLAHRRHPHLGLWLRRRWRAWREPHRDAAPRWLHRDLVRHMGIPREPVYRRHPTRPDAQRSLLGTLWQSVFDVYDRAWTGTALEARWPFLDPRVIAFAFAIPPVPWCQKKALVRRAFRDDLPEPVLRRPKTTLGGWLEVQDTRWRRAQDWRTLTLGASVAEFVDTRQVLHSLRTGSTEELVAAWRVLELDHWLRQVDQDGRA